jgi:hypothetical protein
MSKVSSTNRLPRMRACRVVVASFFSLLILSGLITYHRHPDGSLSRYLPTYPIQTWRQKPNEHYHFWATDGTHGSIRQRLAEYSPYNPNGYWTRNIIQSWRTLLNSSDDFFASWEENNPNFDHIFFLDGEQDQCVRHISSHNLHDIGWTYFELLQKRIFRSDFFRYVAIWALGGIWADVDTWNQRPFDEWIAYAGSPTSSLAALEPQIGMIVGMEYDHFGDANWTGVCQYVFAAKPGHPVLLEIIAQIVEKAGDIANRLEQDLDYHDVEVLETTGPAFFTKIVTQWIKRQWDSSFNVHRDWHNLTEPKLFGDILVMPVWAFGAGRGWGPAPTLNDPRVCVGHQFQGSWIGGGGK